MTGWLHALAAAGVAAGVIATGAWLAARLRYPLPLAIPAGIAVWSVPMMVAAVAGLFEPAVLGIVGYACLLLLRFSAPRMQRTHLRWQSLLLPGAALLALTVAYLGFPSQTLLGTRDEGLYTLTGLLLERTGGVRLAWPSLADIPALFAPSIAAQPMFLPGVYAYHGALLPQFSALVPAWIAQLHAAAGDTGLFRLNGLLCLVSVPLFHALARRIVARPAAWLATAFFALDAAQIWIARVNLSEPLGQVLVLGGLMATVLALRQRGRAPVAVAALFFGVAVLARLDMVLVVPLLLLAAGANATWSARYGRVAAARLHRIAAASFAAQCVAVAVLWLDVPPYLVDNADVLVAALAANACAALFAWLAVRGAFDALRTPSRRRLLALLAATALLGLFVFAAWYRPAAGPFAVITTPGHPWVGQRDYREAALPSLAAYATWPGLVLALAGAIVALTRTVRGRATAGVALIACVVVPIGLIVLANPRVSPDHFWASRRFVPLVLPGVALLSAYGAQALLLPLVGRRQRAVLAAATLFAAVALLHAQRATIGVRENVGTLQWARDLDALAAGAPIVLTRDSDPVATTLLLGFGRAVAPLRDAAAAVDPVTRALWSRCSEPRPCLLLHDGFEGLAGLAVGPSRRVDLSRTVIEPAFVPLPVHTVTVTMPLLATPVRGLDPAEAPGRFTGAYRDWRRDDRGLYRDETGIAGSARWTDGHAEWELPAVGADRLELTFGVIALPRTVEVRIDGERRYAATLAPGDHRIVLPLDPTSVPKARRLALLSDTFVPNQSGLGLDGRTLGVRLTGARLLESTTRRLVAGAPTSSYASRLARVSTYPLAPIGSATPLPAVTLSIANDGDAAWPVQGDLRAGEAPVRVGLAWHRIGATGRVLEQRIDLPFALAPGERVLLAPILDPVAADGTPLPAGEYVVSIGLVHEGVAWFADRGGGLIDVSVTIAAGRAVAHRPAPEPR